MVCDERWDPGTGAVAVSAEKGGVWVEEEGGGRESSGVRKMEVWLREVGSAWARPYATRILYPYLGTRNLSNWRRSIQVL